MDMKIDPLTGKEFIPKRSNQIFENSANRIKFNNQKARNFRIEHDYINKPLIKNVKILDELLTNKTKVTFHREFLKGKGFDFTVMTHYDNFEGTDYPCLYQYMITEISTEKITVRKND
ncbi:hypothetical protein [Flavobacterium sp. AG291]|uniref:hypothetical protein n=1 Tax=Flavobacterium sp. AG291 TaxID=2184000 RepID=UPI000E0BEB18|nr:hypothetical protein [Flavobacterium sp. AG291]RDI14420.1 hypothetical protein DEU42_102113 [Flavobacterium sp. AG291]